VNKLSQQLHDASIEYEGARIRGLLCAAGDEILKLDTDIARLKFRLKYIYDNINDNTAIRFGLASNDWEIDKAIKEEINQEK